MTGGSADQSDIACALVWKLARSHGWSNEVDVSDLAADAAVQDEKRARDVARNQLPDKQFIGFHQGRDKIWLDPPPGDDLAEFLKNGCGYSDLQVDTTLDSYL